MSAARAFPRRLGWLLVLAALALLGAELGARLDDWVFLGVPPLSNPTYDSELRLADRGFVRGKPNGRFRRWQLNEHGFNGPPNDLLPRPGCPRVVVLGASETFGSFESPEREFVSELRRRLAAEGCFEVLNASIVGMSVASATAYWNGWLRQFRPAIVLLYPNPLLGLRISEDSERHCVVAPPAPATPAEAPARAPANGLRSRFVDRLRDGIDKPQWLADAQVDRRIAREVRAHAPGWVMEEVPPSCLEGFRGEVEALVAAVAASGALPVVATHAFRCEGHEADCHRWLRQWVPRVAGEGQVRYHREANALLRSLADGSRARVFDADGVLAGCDACFADPVHFSDEGASRLAAALATFLARLPAQGGDALQ